MTKIYDIAHLNDHMYMVEKHVYVEVGEVGISRIKENYTIVGKVSKKLRAGLSEINNIPCHRPYKVLASTDPSLGLPLLPAAEEKLPPESEINEFITNHKSSTGFMSEIEENLYFLQKVIKQLKLKDIVRKI